MNDAGTPDRSRSFARGTVSHDAAWSLAYSIAVRLATVGLSVAVARLVGSAGAGALGIALQVTALGALLAAFNLPQSAAKHLAETPDRARRGGLLRTSGLLVFGFGLAVCAALLALSPVLARRLYHDPQLQRVLFWCGPLVLATALYAWVEGALQGLRRFSSLTRWGATVSLVDLALGLCSAFFGVVGVLITRTIVRAGAVAFAATRWFGIGARDPHRESDADAADEPRPLEGSGALLGYAGPALLAAAVVLIGQTALRLLLVRRAGLAAAGHYQAADSLAQGLLLIPTAAAAAFMPAVSRDRQTGHAGLPRALKRALEQVTGYNLGLCLLLIGVLPWTVTLLFGPEFEPARPVLIVLASAYGLAGPGLIFGAVMLGRGEVWIGCAVNVIWALVALGTFQFATGSSGAAGAALAVAVAYVVLLLICVTLLVPLWSVPVASLLPALLVNLVSLAAGCALALSPRVPAAVSALVCAALGALVFAHWGLPSLKQSPIGRIRI